MVDRKARIARTIEATYSHRYEVAGGGGYFRFQPGDFPFATTINGEALACRYAPSVKAKVDEVGKKIGRDVGDSDEDGRWEIIAVVNGTTGKLMARAEGIL